MSRLLRGVALALLFMVLAFALLTGRAIQEGGRAMERSDAAFNQGDLREALIYARRAATAYAPGAPHVELGYARMQAIAIGAEAQGSLGLAAEAWRAVRGAALETRSVWIPREEELARANRALARLASRGQEDPKVRQSVLDELQQSGSPSSLWVLLMGFGFLCASAGLIWAGFLGVNPEGALQKRPLFGGVSLALVGTLCWTIAVWLA